MFRSAPSKYPGRSGVLTVLQPKTALLAAALIGMALLLAGGAPPAAAQEQTGDGLVAWGWTGFSGEQAVPTSAKSGVKAVAAGVHHSLALMDDGTVFAWGLNFSGQRTVPDDLGYVKAVSAGEYHSLALKEDGGVVAWGYDGYGQSTVPASAQSGVSAISAGREHNLALKDGSVVAWGNNGAGRSTVPASAQSGVTAIAAGVLHSLALKDGGVVGWGNNNYGQTAVPPGAQSGVTAIDGGYGHSLALKDDGSVVGWGWNADGQSNVPAGLSDVIAIAAGEYHSLALKEDGSVVAWGSNTSGESTVPASAQSGVSAIFASDSRTLALDDITPPARVELFDAEAGEGQASLSWVDPQDADFTATRVLRSTTGFATGPEPSATQSVAYEGAAEAFTDTDLENGTTYYYTAFAGDDGDNWSARDGAQATPRDATAPETTIASSGPPRLSNSASATFQFTSTEAGSTFECSLDDAPFAGCASGVTYEDLDDGFHIFEVQATDAAGNVEPAPARRAWTVDTVAPGVKSVGPSGSRVSPTADVTAAFSEAMDEMTVEAAGVVTLRKGTGAPVAAAVDYDPSTKVATLNPSANLMRGATYKAVVSAGAKDLAGNGLDQAPTLTGDQPKQWSFTVRR